MAERGSWSSIERFGLLSTTALLDLFEIAGDARVAIESVHRPESVSIRHPVHGTAWIRDNQPINQTVLRRTLAGMTEPEWYRSLNGRVFFWLSERRLAKMRAASLYSEREHDILVFSTESLLSAHAETVELSPINSGAVHAGCKISRSARIFRSISEYPWLERVRVAPRDPIVEFTVAYAVPNVSRHVIDVCTERRSAVITDTSAHRGVNNCLFPYSVE